MSLLMIIVPSPVLSSIEGDRLPEIENCELVLGFPAVRSESVRISGPREGTTQSSPCQFRKFLPSVPQYAFKERGLGAWLQLFSPRTKLRAWLPFHRVSSLETGERLAPVPSRYTERVRSSASSASATVRLMTSATVGVSFMSPVH